MCSEQNMSKYSNINQAPLSLTSLTYSPTNCIDFSTSPSYAPTSPTDMSINSIGQPFQLEIDTLQETYSQDQSPYDHNIPAMDKIGFFQSADGTQHCLDFMQGFHHSEMSALASKIQKYAEYTKQNKRAIFMKMAKSELDLENNLMPSTMKRND